MSTRPAFGPFSIFTNSSMAASLISKVTFKHMIPAVNYSLNWTGAPVGTFSVEISNDYAENPDGTVKIAGNWVTLPLSTPITAAGTPDIASIDVVTSANCIRVHYVRTSGTGTLNGLITGAVL